MLHPCPEVFRPGEEPVAALAMESSRYLAIVGRYHSTAIVSRGRRMCWVASLVALRRLCKMKHAPDTESFPLQVNV